MPDLATGASALCTLRAVTVIRGGRQILGPLDLTLPPGAIVGVFGGEGLGKSTLLKLLAGLLQPVDGDLSWPLGVPERGMLFQREGLLDDLTVAENAGLPLRRLPPSARALRVADALAAVGLAPDASKLPAQLSGGMKKRAGIARLLAGHPAVKLYDDPVAGLDPITAGEVLRLIAAAHEPSGLTLMVSADPRGLLPLCSLAYRLEGGRLVSFVGEV